MIRFEQPHLRGRMPRRELHRQLRRHRRIPRAMKDQRGLGIIGIVFVPLAVLNEPVAQIQRSPLAIVVHRQEPASLPFVNPLPFDVLNGDADVTVAIDVSGAPIAPGKRPHPSAFAALMSSSQIMQRTIVREKLKVQQPDVYIDVEVDEYYVLDFHRFKQILAAAAPAKEQLRRQLDRVLASQTLETLPAVAAPEPAASPPNPPQRKGRLPSLNPLSPKPKA